MKATEFVKNCGIGEAKRVLKDARGCTGVKLYGKYEFSTEELKRLIESHEIVEYLGGCERSKARLKMARKNGTTFGADHLRWEKAIADVEACQPDSVFTDEVVA